MGRIRAAWVLVLRSAVFALLVLALAVAIAMTAAVLVRPSGLLANQAAVAAVVVMVKMLAALERSPRPHGAGAGVRKPALRSATLPDRDGPRQLIPRLQDLAAHIFGKLGGRGEVRVHDRQCIGAAVGRHE